MEMYLLLKTIKRFIEKQYVNEHYPNLQVDEDDQLNCKLAQDIEQGKLSGLYYCVLEKIETIHNDPLEISKMAEIGCAVLWNLEKEIDFIPLMSKANLDYIVNQYREEIINGR